jgi:hypothetical protein
VFIAGGTDYTSVLSDAELFDDGPEVVNANETVGFMN